MRLKKLWKNRENTYERNSREIIKRKPNANIGLPTNKTVSQLHKKNANACSAKSTKNIFA